MLNTHNPFALSLSKGEMLVWFDKLTTNDVNTTTNDVNNTTNDVNNTTSGVNVVQAPSPALYGCRAGEDACATVKAL